jgi:putative ABC transport system permease protein
MWRHYFSMAGRGLLRHRLYSLINIVGLAVGLTCVIFVILFVRDELSYDGWIPGMRNVYRVELTIDIPGRGPLRSAVIPYPMPAVMRDQIPGVTGMTRLYTQNVTLANGDRQFAQNVDVVDPGFFRLIHLPLVAGNPGSVFRQPESIVLSQSAARNDFGDADPIGRTLTTADPACGAQAAGCPQILLRVTGVMRDLPHNTHDRRCLHPDDIAGQPPLADRATQLDLPGRLGLRAAGSGSRPGLRRGADGADFRP